MSEQSTQHRHLIVHGIPKPQGSKTLMPNGAMLNAGSKQARLDFATWRNSIAAAAADSALDFGWCDWPTIDIAVRFRFPMPASRPVKVRQAGVAWKPSAPDLDKLIRTVGDALQGTLIANDSKIVSWSATKLEVFNQWTGADITLRPAITIPMVF